MPTTEPTQGTNLLAPGDAAALRSMADRWEQSEWRAETLNNMADKVDATLARLAALSAHGGGETAPDRLPAGAMSVVFRIVSGAVHGDDAKVRAYAGMLADLVEARGDASSAGRLRSLLDAPGPAIRPVALSGEAGSPIPAPAELADAVDRIGRQVEALELPLYENGTRVGLGHQEWAMRELGQAAGTLRALERQLAARAGDVAAPLQPDTPAAPCEACVMPATCEKAGTCVWEQLEGPITEGGHDA